MKQQALAGTGAERTSEEAASAKERWLFRELVTTPSCKTSEGDGLSAKLAELAPSTQNNVLKSDSPC